MVKAWPAVVLSPLSPHRFWAAFRRSQSSSSTSWPRRERPRLRSSSAAASFFSGLTTNDLASRDLSHVDGVADHVGGTALAFRSGGHRR